MSDKSIPYHLRGIINLPPHLNQQQQQSWIKTAIKANKNHQLQRRYPPLTVLTSIYQVIFVHQYTTSDTMQMLIDRVRNCDEFTFDTESEKTSKELALIQIQTIPHQLPLYVVIIELAHLPSINLFPNKTFI